MKTYLLITLASLLLIGCNTEVNKGQKDSPDNIQKPVASIDESPKFNIEVPLNQFQFSDSKDQVLLTEKNTRIYVSKNSFEDKNGEDVVGEVEIVFKEYHTTGEIIASKIPMEYQDETGAKGAFESAGMFDIRAYQDGNDLILKKGKTIRVDLNSEESGPYNFYNYSENDLAWVEKDSKCLPVKNQVKVQLLSEIDSLVNLPKVKPKKPIAYKKGDPLFDMNIDYLKYPGFRDLNGVMWKITDTSETKKNFANKHLFNKEYEMLRAEPLENENLEFDLFFTYKKKVISVRAAPVMQGKLLSKQKKKYKDLIKTMTENAKRENAIQDQLKRENDLLRTFNVDKLGIYNYDLLYKDPRYIPVAANFKFEGYTEELQDEMCVYLIPANKKVVARFTKSTFKNFCINPRDNNKLIAILPNNEVYYLSNTDIRRMNLEQFENKPVDIVLKKFKKVGKAEQLDDLIASL